MTDFEFLAEKAGIRIVYGSIPNAGAIALQSAVCLDISTLYSESRRVTMLAHELGHIQTGALYTADASQIVRAQAETRARRWAIRRLISRDEIDELIRGGYTEPWQMADKIGLPEETIREALNYYFN